MKVKGFTIVELLIVIVVIGILASITVVAFSGIRARALESEKASKLNQTLKALDNYKTINGYYPFNGEVSGSSGAALLGMSLKAVVPSDAPDQNQGLRGQTFIASSEYYITYMATDGYNGLGFQCNSAPQQCTSFYLSYYDRIKNQAVTIIR